MDKTSHYDCHCYEADPNCPIHGETGTAKLHVPTHPNCALCGTGPMNVYVIHEGKSYCWNCIGKVDR